MSIPNASMTEPHPMMPKVSHDEMAEQFFVSDLKTFIFREIEPAQAKLMNNKVIPEMTKKSGRAPENHIQVRGEMEKEVDYQDWATLVRTAQEMMWDSVGTCVDRQLDELITKADVKNPKGSLTLDPNFVVPRYIDAFDIHCMPGNYHAVTKANDVRQGAVFDRAAAIYHMGRNGGFMNDIRGHTIVSHFFERWPDHAPQRILDVGCTVGHTTVAVASYFPKAEVHAIDVGAGLLRYAWARSEHVGVGVHYSQQNAETTNFPDNHFDLVYSSAVLHETSHAALPRIMAECRRILKPGGVMIHLEVPGHYGTLDTWGRIRGDFEIFYNNEPFWRGALTTDFKKLVMDAGFKDVQTGFQDATKEAKKGTKGFFDESKGVHVSWFMVSGTK
ncbi:MAG: class I SAM-dependent methyltransferase [Rhodospirillaceae bacterium]|nr:class I SAM-dependent methyltransferase [Rhodospirillaceae bacterium]